MLDLNSDLLLKVSNITIQAGSEIMKYYLEDLEIITKKDNKKEYINTYAKLKRNISHKKK